MKRCTISLGIREMLIITMVGYCYTSTRTVINKIKKQNKTKKLAVVLVLARMRNLELSYISDEI